MAVVAERTIRILSSASARFLGFNVSSCVELLSRPMRSRTCIPPQAQHKGTTHVCNARIGLILLQAEVRAPLAAHHCN